MNNMPLRQDNYNDTVNFLYGLQYHGIKLGLENPDRLMSLLGNCHRSFRSVHVAGTNGKGSTASMIASILKSCGFKVGLYTSPHLTSFTERIKINDSPISESDVINMTSHIRKVISHDHINPTFFEFVTALAFCYFTREKVDWAVVETGMGGRLDATNVLLPDLSIITNISLDHSEYLGETIPDIAHEKAGIIKRSIPVITAATDKAALEIIERTAGDRRSALHIHNRDFKGSLLSMDSDHILFDYTGFSRLGSLYVSASGRHQILNAAMAVRACEVLSQRGLPMPDDAISNGLGKLHIEGRLETVSKKPLIIIDGAHNPEAADALSQSMTACYPSNKIILIAGIMQDKNIMGILRPLAGISHTAILTKPDCERAASPETMKEALEHHYRAGDNKTMRSIITCNSLPDALNTAKKICGNDGVILVTGSFYTAGEAKDILGNKEGILNHLRENYSSGNRN